MFQCPFPSFLKCFKIRPVMDMQRFMVFEESIYPAAEEFLEQLEQEARAEEVPIIRKDTQAYLRSMLLILKPKRILEIGTAVGFSAILMAKHSEAEIITMENYAPRIQKAKENIRAAGLSERITLLEGDAEELLQGIEGEFDLIFIDAAKGQYALYFERIKPHIHGGSVIISDNVLVGGDVLESRFAVRRRDRTIHKRMRDFLYDVCHDEKFESALLPVGDGLLVSVKK